jgi:outer membrane receptor for Fe3+-dicitrate
MFREESADLWSNPLTTPIAPRQNRQYNEAYANGTLAGHHRGHDWKAGVEVRYGSIHEDFGYHLVAYRIGNVRLFDRDTPADFSFIGHALNREQSGYIQDEIHLGSLTASVGIRFDHYSLLVNEHGFSPRVALAYNIAPIGLVLHASYDRSFATPPFENILVSASPQAAALNNASIYLPLRPSRGNYYEFGLSKGFAGHIRLDASYFLRDIHNFQDDDLLENTGVSFPIEFNRARIRGVEAKLTVPRWGRFSGFLSYANTRGIAEFPIAGGLFLEDTAQSQLTDNSRFPVSQDQRNTARANLRYQIGPRVWTSWKASYNSGLPTEVNDSNSYAFLVSQYGQAVVNKVNFDRGRVNPWFSLDASLGIDLWKHEKQSATFQFDALNLTDRLNVIDFAGFLSGTAIAPPRSYGARLRLDF